MLSKRCRRAIGLCSDLIKCTVYYFSVNVILILSPSSYRKLRELILSYKNDQIASLNPLSMKLKGTVDPAVMGGIKNYEEVRFFLSLSSILVAPLTHANLCCRRFSPSNMKPDILKMSKTFPDWRIWLLV